MTPSIRVFIGSALIAAAALQARTLRLGIVVGDNQGSSEDPRLRYAEEDARRMTDLFEEVGGIAHGNLITLKSPLPENLDDAFEKIGTRARVAAPGDEVLFFFYYSGHGTGEALKLGENSYPLAELKKRIEQVPAKLHVAVLDACQSGAITRLKGAKVVQPFIVEQNVRSNGTIIITSSSADENSQESDQLKGSFFTHYWLTALRGAGDVSGDRRVSLLEAYEYAFNRTVLETSGTRGGVQHPNAQFKFDSQGDVILTDLNGGEGGLMFASELQGDFLVADKGADVMGEFRKERGKESFMALPSGGYRIYQKDGAQSREGRVELAARKTLSVTGADLSAAALFSGLSKGGPREPAVALPWKVENWAQQHPWEIGLGFSLQSDQHISGGKLKPFYQCLVAQAAYRFLGSFDVMFDVTFPVPLKTYDMDEWEEPEFTQGIGLRAGKFLATNFEGLAKVYHRAAYRTGDDYGYDAHCMEDTTGCSSYYWRGTERSWHFLGGTGMEFSLRLWAWSQVALEAGWGFEYNWQQGNFNATPVRIVPSMHF